MLQSLEIFAKRYRLRILFEETTRKRVLISSEGKESRGKVERNWTCNLLSPFMAQPFIYHREKPVLGVDVGVGGTLLSSKGKTLKESRDNMVKFIRGVKLKSGHNLDLEIKVPKNLQ